MIRLASFWRWLARFAYRRLIAADGPDDAKWGIPGKRDVDNPCEYYSPHPMHLRRRGDAFPWKVAGCMGDGHALCPECVWRQADEEDNCQ